MSLRKTLSVRLTEEQSNLIEVLRTEKKLSSYISLLLAALLQDRVSTTQYLLGLSDQSVAYNDLPQSTNQANLYEKWLALKIEEPFADWVSTLRSAEIKHYGGLDMPLVDVKSALLDLLDDLGLELVEKGSTSTEIEGNSDEDNSSVDTSTTSLGVNSTELKDLVASMVQEILSTKSTNQGVEQYTPEAPTEPLTEIEMVDSTITPQELENAPESATEPQSEVADELKQVAEVVEETPQPVSPSSEVSSQESTSSTSEIDNLMDTSALMSAFG